MTAAFAVAAFSVMASFRIGTHCIVAACDGQRSSLDQHLRQLLSRLVIHRLNGSPGNPHLLSTHFLGIVQPVDQSDSLVFIYCHGDFFDSRILRASGFLAASICWSESTALRYSAHFSAFFRSWHILHLSCKSCKGLFSAARGFRLMSLF